ncbi:MAG: hypothetical protein V1889_00850 [archaeon]
MRNLPSQDNLDRFRKTLEHYNIIDWETFFHLDTDQRASAEQDLQKCNILSQNPEGHYEVLVGIRKITPASVAPKYFTAKITAEGLKNFYESRNQQVTIIRY